MKHFARRQPQAPLSPSGFAWRPYHKVASDIPDPDCAVVTLKAAICCGDRAFADMMKLLRL
jgi:hypothetical protein